MNSNKLIKDATILELVKILEEKYGSHAFKIKDYWDADLCAIGLTNLSGTRLIYISTYNQQTGHFNVHLESLLKDSDFPYKSEKELLGVTNQELENIFREHLGLYSA